MIVLAFLCGEETSYKVTEISFLQTERERNSWSRTSTNTSIGPKTEEKRKHIIIVISLLFLHQFQHKLLASFSLYA